MSKQSAIINIDYTYIRELSITAYLQRKKYVKSISFMLLTKHSKRLTK